MIIAYQREFFCSNIAFSPATYGLSHEYTSLLKTIIAYQREFFSSNIAFSPATYGLSLFEW